LRVVSSLYSEKRKSLLDLVLQECVLELLLAEYLFGFLTSSHEIRHDSLCGPIWKIFVNFHVWVLRKFYSELVRESFQLSKSDSVVIYSESFDLFLSHIDTLSVVAAQKKHTVLGEVLHEMQHVLVVAFMSLLKRIPDWRLVMILLGQFSFFVHVSSSDQFDTKVVSHHLGGSYLKRYDLLHPLEILLETIHYDVFLTSVVFLSKLLPERFDGRLHESLLSIDVKRTISLIGQFGDVVALSGELFEYLQIVLGHTDTSSDGDS
jgi:hypothetical protein